MRADVPKQYLDLAGRAIIEHTLERLCTHGLVAGVVVAVSSGDLWWPRLGYRDDPRVRAVTGGAERCHSVLNALRWLRDRCAPEDWVMVHDAVRPCLTHSDLDRLFATLASHPVGGLLGMRVRDTMKRGDANDEVEGTVDRTGLWHALTPQMFRPGILTRALETALQRDALVTDESAAVELAGFRPRLVTGRSDNIKITRPEDLGLAALFLKRQAEEAGCGSDKASMHTGSAKAGN